MRLRHCLFALVALLLLGGCNSAQQRTYDFSLDNRTPRNLYFGLVKNGPPFEPAWAAPEDLAMANPDPTSTATWGHLVEPGHVGHVSIGGNFASKSEAVVRIYVGRNSLNDLLALRHDDPDRYSTPLPPGRHAVVVSYNDNGRLHVVAVNPAALPPPPPHRTEGPPTAQP